MSQVILEDLVTTVDGRAIGPVRAALGPGGRRALLGPSGVGKSTLLRAMAGLHPITSGTLRLDGADATHWPAERRRVAYLHQTPRLFPHLDVLGNVAFARRVAGAPDAVADARHWLDLVRLGPLAGRDVTELSGGERQRVALARALASRPRALLLDEPFAALDPSLRREMRRIVDALLDDAGPSAVLVTHDVSEAAEFADQAVVLLPDGPAFDGPIATLLHAPPTVDLARFVGGYQIVANPGSLLPDTTGAAILAFRPEALAVAPDPAGRWEVERSVAAAVGFRVSLTHPQGQVEGWSPDFLGAGASATVRLDRRQALAYGPGGRLLPAG